LLVLLLQAGVLLEKGFCFVLGAGLLLLEEVHFLRQALLDVAGFPQLDFEVLELIGLLGDELLKLAVLVAHFIDRGLLVVEPAAQLVNFVPHAGEVVDLILFELIDLAEQVLTCIAELLSRAPQLVLPLGKAGSQITGFGAGFLKSLLLLAEHVLQLALLVLHVGDCLLEVLLLLLILAFLDDLKASAIAVCLPSARSSGSISAQGTSAGS